MTATPETLERPTLESTSKHDAQHTNVYVVLDFLSGPLVSAVYGPFHSANAAKDWGLMHSMSFTVAEIMRPQGVEEVAFVLAPKPKEPTLENQGIHPEQAQIGDYIDPTVVP